MPSHSCVPVPWTSTATALLVLLCVSWSPTAVRSQASTERGHLNRFYDLTDGQRWSNNTGWKSSDPICSWFGVTCEDGDNNDEGVTAIRLQSNNLAGRVAKVVYELPKLRVLDLKDNQLADGGFEAFSRPDVSPDLEVIQLAENALTSMTGIGDAPPSLRVLHLTENRLREFPVELTKLSTIEQLFLSFNQMAGQLPTEIGTMSSLQQLYLYGNDLSGEIPSEVGSMDRLEILTLAENAFTGHVPRSVNNLPKLRVFSVHNNVERKGRLTGKIPSFNHAFNIDEVYLSGNAFTGSIPTNFLRLTNRTENLVTVAIRDNELTGTIPTELLRFQSLNLELTGNMITGLPENLCAKGSWMSGLVETYGCDAIMCPPKTFSINGRQTADSVVCRGCPSADYYGTMECDEVDIVEDWFPLAKLYVKTKGNEWSRNTGWDIIDAALQKDRLEDIDGSSFNVCNWYGVKCNPAGGVTDVELRNNTLVGEIPLELFQLTALTNLDLSRNPITFERAFGLSSIASATLLQSLHLSATNVDALDGLNQAQSLKKLYLDSLDFKSPTMPLEVFALSGLEVLHMQNCGLTGMLPTSIGLLTNLVR